MGVGEVEGEALVGEDLEYGLRYEENARKVPKRAQSQYNMLVRCLLSQYVMTTSSGTHVYRVGRLRLYGV